MIVKLTVDLDLEGFFQALVDDADLSGLGPQETSEYSVSGLSVQPIDGSSWEVVVEVERDEGANASRAMVAERLMTALSDGDYVERVDEA